MSDPLTERTKLLTSHTEGDQGATHRLMSLVYDELRDLAAAHMRRERVDHTLTPTALVNEAYTKLIDDTKIDWEGRTHFFALAAKTIRRILVDHARARNSKKRGGEFERIPLEPDIRVTQTQSVDVLDLDDVLGRLAKINLRQERVVELRVFAGLTTRETAQVLDASERTIKNDWAMARAWLLREIDS